MPLFVEKSGLDDIKKFECQSQVWLVCSIFNFNYICIYKPSLENKITVDSISNTNEPILSKSAPYSSPD